MKTLDVAAVVKDVNEHLSYNGFVARDADENDFANPAYPGLRFKTGTVYGEVGVQIVRDGKCNPMETIRILNPGQIGRAKEEITKKIQTFLGGPVEVGE